MNYFLIFLFSSLVSIVISKAIISKKETNCFVEHNGQKLHEGDSVEINSKFYKVEDCALHRAFNACGPHIIYIVNIVCQAVEQHRSSSAGKNRVTRFAQQKLLTEACCQNLCTVSEMTRYCPH